METIWTIIIAEWHLFLIILFTCSRLDMSSSWLEKNPTRIWGLANGSYAIQSTKTNHDRNIRLANSVALSRKIAQKKCLFVFLLVYAACHPERITSIFYCWGKLNKTRDQSTIFTQPNNTSCYSQLYSFQFRRTKKNLDNNNKILKKKNGKCQKKEKKQWYKYSNWMIVHFQWCVTRV